MKKNHKKNVFPIEFDNIFAIKNGISPSRGHRWPNFYHYSTWIVRFSPSCAKIPGNH